MVRHGHLTTDAPLREEGPRAHQVGPGVQSAPARSPETRDLGRKTPPGLVPSGTRPVCISAVHVGKAFKIILTCESKLILRTQGWLLKICLLMFPFLFMRIFAGPSEDGGHATPPVLAPP